MKIFTRAEVSGYINGLGLNPTQLITPEVAQVLIAASTLKIDITVDEIRKVLGSAAHPDPVKGAKYIWEEEL